MESETIKKRIERAFAGPNSTDRLSNLPDGHYELEDVEFFANANNLADRYGMLLHGTYALNYFTEEAFLFFFPRLLIASLDDNFRYQPFLDEMLSGLSGVERKWGDFVGRFSIEQINAVSEWLKALDCETDGNNSFQIKEALEHLNAFDQRMP